MAKQPNRTAPKGKAGKSGKSKPITGHQLFPAVVALWFGALFGLGSLAVRPTLLESLVMKSRLDLVVPAAAPPLGITARILIALIMAALGSVIGILIARRLGRPKVELRQRKRGAKASDEAPRTSYFGQTESGSVFEEAASSGGVLAGRRRGSLAFEHDEVEFIPHEMAPLPGGAPQVLDISGIELAEHEPATAEFVAGHRPAAPPLDLGAFAEPAPAPAPASLFAAPPAQVFQPPVAEPAASEGPYDHTPQSYLPAEPTPAQRQIFGMPVENDHIDQNFIREAGFKTSVFETEEAAPLFPDRQSPVAAEPAPFAAPTAAPVSFAAPEPQAVAPLPQTPAAFAAPIVPEVQPEPAPAALAQPAPAPAPQPITGLGMTDLASRLQQSMERRRAARAAAPLEAEAVAEAPAQPDFAAVEPEAPAPVANEPVAEFTPPAPFIAPFAVEAITPPPPFAAPAAPLTEAASLLSPAPAHAGPDPVAEIPPPPMAMPAALRPLDLGHDLQDDDDMLASLLPPRHVPMPAAVLAAAQAAPPPFASHEPAIEPEAGAEEDAESYASLLDIGQPLAARSTAFVRIEEPEAHGDAVEPVVIFPGQGAFGGPQAAPFAQPATGPVAPMEASGDAVPFRRFDAPSAAGQGVPVAAPAGPQAADPAEAEQALRAALANLQRMSGAA